MPKTSASEDVSRPMQLEQLLRHNILQISCENVSVISESTIYDDSAESVISESRAT